MADPNTRQGKRTPVTLKIKFKSETLEQFIERYAVDVSQGGIFIRTKEPLAVGTQMKFEFQLRDASPLIAGEGTVVWTRENDPSRPAIAPGMGVRFDRLSDGSQPVLERILSEKARQAPQRPLKDTTKPPLFTDTPTRVAPAPIQEALTGPPIQSRTSTGQRSRSDSMDEKTPLPKPMPFHSDADDFSEEAFEEATKVRSLDELVAQTALAEPSKPVARPQDELAARRGADVPLHEPKPASAVDRDSAPGLPSPPETSRPTPKVLDTTPSPRESTPSQPPANKTRLGLEAPVPVAPAQSPSAGTASESRIPSRPPIKDAVTVASGIHAVAQPAPDERDRRASSSSNLQAQRVPSAKRPSSAPIIIGIFLVVAAAGAALWFFVLREPAIEGAKVTNGSNKIVTPGSDVVTPGSGSDTVTNNGSAGSGSNGSATQMNNGGSGSAEKPAGPTVDTTIASNVEKAEIEIVGTDQKGVAPFVAKLEKDKTYKAKVTAPGYLPAEIDVKAGDKPTAKLDAKKFIITVTSNPPGAAVAVDGVVGKNPYELKTPPKKPIRVQVAKAGFRAQVFMIDPKAWTEDDKTMTFTKDVTLEKAAIVQNPNNGSNTTGSGSGSGSAKEPAGSGTTPPTGSGGGSANTPPDEPEPSF